MSQITSKEDFVSSLKRGDVFCWIETLRDGVPWVVRQSKILGVYSTLNPSKTKKYLNVRHQYVTEGGNTKVVESAIGDLISPLRGVYTSQEEAQATLIKRRQDMKSDPQLLPMLIQEAYSEAMGSVSRLQENLSCTAV